MPYSSINGNVVSTGGAGVYMENDEIMVSINSVLWPNPKPCLNSEAYDWRVPNPNPSCDPNSNPNPNPNPNPKPNHDPNLSSNTHRIHPALALHCQQSIPSKLKLQPQCCKTHIPNAARHTAPMLHCHGLKDAHIGGSGS